MQLSPKLTIILTRLLNFTARLFHILLIFKWANPGLFLFVFRLFYMSQLKYSLMKA